MRITLLTTTILLFISISLYSQTTPLPATLILHNGDTLRGKVLAKPNIFWKTLIYESSVNQRIKFRNESGEKVKFKDEEIARLEFTDLKGRKRVFVSKDYVRLLELMHDGVIKWYRDYYTIDIYQSNQSQADFIYDENGTRFHITNFNSKKNKMKEIVKNDPELSDIIKESKMDDENMLQILQLYEKKLASK